LSRDILLCIEQNTPAFTAFNARYHTSLLMLRASVSVPSLEPYIRPRGRCFIVCSFHARFTPSTTMNSLSRGFRAGGISDYTRVRPKADCAAIAGSLNVDRLLWYRVIKLMLSRSIRSREFQLLGSAWILSLSPKRSNDKRECHSRLSIKSSFY